MSKILAALAASLALFIAPVGSAGATQAYGDGWAVPSTGGPNPAIKACSTSGNVTTVRTVGGAVFEVENLRIIGGHQDIDNLVLAQRFREIRHAATGQRVQTCRVKTVGGVRRAIVTTRGGAKWALIKPSVGDYYMEWA